MRERETHTHTEKERERERAINSVRSKKELEGDGQISNRSCGSSSMVASPIVTKTRFPHLIMFSSTFINLIYVYQDIISKLSNSELFPSGKHILATHNRHFFCCVVYTFSKIY